MSENIPTPRPMFRQGDILLIKEDSLPSTRCRPLKVAEQIVLAEGEITGHLHAIHETSGAKAYVTRETDSPPSPRNANTITMQPDWLDLTEPRTSLEHPEHATIDLPPGIYRVVRQREYSALNQIRQVYD